MMVTSRQVMTRANCNETELKRLRQIMNVPSRGSGNRLDYDQRMADVFVTLWTAMLDMGRINTHTTAGHRMGLSWGAYARIGQRLLTQDRAVLEAGLVRVEVRIVTTDWSRISTVHKVPR